MMHPVNVWTGMNDVTSSTECVDRNERDVTTSTVVSDFRPEKISTKDIFSQRYGSDLGFS